MYFMPKEFVIGGVYFPPLLIAGILGVAGSMALTAMLFNRYRLSRFIYNPPLDIPRAFHNLFGFDWNIY